MKKAIVALSLCLPALASAADVLTEHAIDRDQVQQSLLSFAVHGTTWIPRVPKTMKALPAAQRAAVVRALGAFARAWFESDDFKARYAEAREATRPEKPQPPRSGKALEAEQRAELDRSIAEAEAMMAHLPPDQQAAMREALEGMRTAPLPNAELLGQVEQSRFEDDLREYEEALKQMPPEDPREALKAQLRRFLDLTEGVDFDAKLVAQHGLKRFEREDYESKPAEWKLCFRAGREATGAARAFAQEWLKALK